MRGVGRRGAGRRARAVLAVTAAAIVSLGAAWSTAAAAAPPTPTKTPGFSGFVTVVEHHVQPVFGSDATYQPVPFGTDTGSYTYEARFNGQLDPSGLTIGTATATIDDVYDHDAYFCYSSTLRAHGSGQGPVTLSSIPDTPYPMAAAALTMPVRTVIEGGTPECNSDTTGDQSVGGTMQPYNLEPEVTPANPGDVLAGTRTYTDPPNVQNVLVPDGTGTGGFNNVPTTFTRTVTITWRLTHLADRDHDGFPDSRDRCPRDFGGDGSTDGCPRGGARPAAPTGKLVSSATNKAPGPVVSPTKQRSHVVAAIPTVKDVSKSGKLILINLVIVGVVVLLITFPAELFNSTLEEHYDEVRGWFRLPWHRRQPIAPRPSPLDIPRQKRIGLYLGFVVAAALLNGFLDPTFGLNTASATLFLGLVIGIPVVTLVSNFALLVYARVKHGDRGVMRVLPGSIFVGAACVAISRLTHFAPGYLYGLIAGFVFSHELSKNEEGKRAAVTSTWVLASSLLAWLALSSLQSHVAGGVPGFGWEVLLSTLTCVFLGGIEGLALGLIPLRTLVGEKVFSWSKPAWLALFGSTLFVFVHLLLHPLGDFGNTQHSAPLLTSMGFSQAAHPVPLFTWLGLFLGFGLASVVFWGYFRFRPQRPTPGPGVEVEDVAVAMSEG